jgi:hypothetical protein
VNLCTQAGRSLFLFHLSPEIGERSSRKSSENSEKNFLNKTEGSSECRRQRCIGSKMATEASRIERFPLRLRYPAGRDLPRKQCERTEGIDTLLRRNSGRANEVTALRLGIVKV